MRGPRLGRIGRRGTGRFVTKLTAAYPRGRLCWPASMVATAAAGLLS